MGAPVSSPMAYTSAFSPSRAPRICGRSMYSGYSCACAEAVSERLRESKKVGAVCSLCMVSPEQNNLRLPTFTWGKELDIKMMHQTFDFGRSKRLPLIRKHHGCLQRPIRVKSGEFERDLGSEGMTVDEETLQQRLEMAIKDEDYALAAKLRDNLQHLHEDSKAAVLAANSRFYNAFRNGNLVGMRSIWAKGDNICCVHPGAGAISGHDLVMDSWEVVCGADHEFPIKIELKDLEVYVKGDVGYVTCLEVIKTKGSSWGKQVATNVFERVDGQWYICIHHASHVDL